MNKFIEFDIHNGVSYLKCAILNIINELISGNETGICIEHHIPLSLVRECFMKELGYDENNCDSKGDEYWMYFKKDNSPEIIVRGNIYHGTLKMSVNEN